MTYVKLLKNNPSKHPSLLSVKYKNIEGSSGSSRKSSLPKSCIIGPSPNRFSQGFTDRHERPIKNHCSKRSLWCMVRAFERSDFAAGLFSRRPYTFIVYAHFRNGYSCIPCLDRILWTDFSVIGCMFDPAKLFGSVKGRPGGPWIPGLSQALNILGSHQFTHGRHYWEVEIAPFDLVECSNWIIGVSYSSVERNSWLGASEGTWILPCNGILMP